MTAKAQGKVRDALEKLKAASAIAPTAIILREQARTHLELQELIEAREAFLAVGRLPIDPRETARSTEARRESAKLAEELRARIPSLTVVVRGTTVDSLESITVDGQSVVKAAVGTPRPVNPGTHEVVGKVQDGSERRVSATLVEGENKEAVLTFDPPKATAAGAGSPTPTSAIAQPPNTAPLPPPTTASRGHLPWWSWAGFGVAGAGAIVGGVTGALVLGQASDIKDACTSGRCPTSERDSLQSARDLATVSDVAFVVAGVGAAVGVVGLFVGSGASADTARPTGLRLVPSVGLGSASITGSF